MPDFKIQVTSYRVINTFRNLIADKEPTPNRFTIAMGEIIRKVRIEANMTQSELAERAYFSQTAISQIEQGKRDVSAAEILYFSAALDKPILYFYTPFIGIGNNEDELSPLESELIKQAKRLPTEDLRKLVAQTKALADLNQPDTSSL